MLFLAPLLVRMDKVTSSGKQVLCKKETFPAKKLRETFPVLSSCFLLSQSMSSLDVNSQARVSKIEHLMSSRRYKDNNCFFQGSLARHEFACECLCGEYREYHVFRCFSRSGCFYSGDTETRECLGVCLCAHLFFLYVSIEPDQLDKYVWNMF